MRTWFIIADCYLPEGKAPRGFKLEGTPESVVQYFRGLNSILSQFFPRSEGNHVEITSVTTKPKRGITYLEL